MLVIGQLGKLLGLSIDAGDPLGQLWEVVDEFGSVERRDGRDRRHIAGGAVRPSAPHATAARSTARRGCSDRALVGVRLRRARGRGRRRDPGRAAELRDRQPCASPTSSSSFRRRSGSSSSRSPTRSSPRAPSPESTTSTCGDRRSCSRWVRRTPRPGFTQGFPVGASGSRTAVNDDMGARSQIAGLIAAADRRRDPAVPHRARAVPAEGRARRGHRLRRGRAGRSAGLAGARRNRPCRGRDRRRDDRPASSSSVCWKRSSSPSASR